MSRHRLVQIRPTVFNFEKDMSGDGKWVVKHQLGLADSIDEANEKFDRFIERETFKSVVIREVVIED